MCVGEFSADRADMILSEKTRKSGESSTVSLKFKKLFYIKTQGWNTSWIQAMISLTNEIIGLKYAHWQEYTYKNQP